MLILVILTYMFDEILSYLSKILKFALIILPLQRSSIFVT